MSTETLCSADRLKSVCLCLFYLVPRSMYTTATACIHFLSLLACLAQSCYFVFVDRFFSPRGELDAFSFSLFEQRCLFYGGDKQHGSAVSRQAHVPQRRYQ